MSEKLAVEQVAVKILAYRVPEAAHAIGVSRAKCYALISAGVIPSIRVGSSLRVPVEALRRWVEEQQQHAG